ncbi:MAG: hypothetical protein JNK68_10950 [Betaproteobacteria bacterium]|nr:hypothetical protein [Betaproteobacteria bacterium]
MEALTVNFASCSAFDVAMVWVAMAPVIVLPVNFGVAPVRGSRDCGGGL